MVDLLTNGLKHGFGERQGELSLSVSLEVSQDHLACVVADDGVGEEGVRTIGSGHGLRIADALAETLNASLERFASRMGTMIRLVMPRLLKEQGVMPALLNAVTTLGSGAAHLPEHAEKTPWPR